MNAVILSVAVVLIFLIAYEVTRNLTGSAMGALFFAIAPTENLYFLMLSNEFLAILSFLTILYIFVKKQFFMSENNGLKKLAGSVLILSLSLFVLKYSKPVGAVFWVAIVIFVIMKKLLSRGEKIRTLAGVVVAAALLSSVFSNIYVQALGKYTQFPINEDASPHFLFIGLYSDYWSVGNIYETLMKEADFEYDIVNEQYMKVIKEDLADNINKLPDKLQENFKEQWQDYNNGLRMVLNELDTESGNPILFTAEGLELWGKVITQEYYLLMLLLAVISALWQVIVKNKESDLNYFFVCLVCFGVALGLVFGESQERYKCVIMPVVYLMAGDGAVKVLSLLHRGGSCLKDKLNFNLHTKLKLNK